MRTTLGTRLSRRTRYGSTHLDVNHSLRRAFTGLIADLEWDVALLQEVPPRWLGDLGRAADATAVGVLTSRNSLAGLRSAVASRNPDLIASNEGGSNVVLARAPLRVVASRHERLARRPERRMLSMVRLRLPTQATLAVANCHLSVPATGRGAAELLRAAELATAWAAGSPLVLGGDLNLRPAQSPAAFKRLEARFGLARPTGPHALDHLLATGLETVERPAPLPSRSREVPGPRGLAIRLSDHAPVTAAFRLR